MNVLIVDTKQIYVDELNDIMDIVFRNSNTTQEDWIVVPKGIDVIQDVSIEWLKMIRDSADKKIKELEKR